MTETVQITARIPRLHKKILKRAVAEGRATCESDAVRVAIWMLGESLEFTKKIRTAIT